MGHKSLIASPNKCDALKDFVYELRDKYAEQRSVDVPVSREVAFFFRESVNVDRLALIQHVESRIQKIPPFEFTIQCATIIYEPIAGYNIALVPDKGLSNLLKISVSLSEGIFLQGLGYGNNIPDVQLPCIMIRWITEYTEAHKIVKEINSKVFAYHGIINSLTLFEHKGIESGWHDIHEFQFKQE